MLTEVLREQTQEQHRELEASIALPLTMKEYIRQLKIYYGFVEPWESSLASVLPENDPILAGRSKTGWLEADLDSFGIGAADRDKLPRLPELPSLSSRPEILGAAYVIEGSTLGGQIISRHLETTLGLRDGCGYRYFQSYGRNVGHQWKAFRAELLQASSPENDPVIVRAARGTFEILQRWFCQNKLVGS